MIDLPRRNFDVHPKFGTYLHALRRTSAWQLTRILRVALVITGLAAIVAIHRMVLVNGYDNSPATSATAAIIASFMLLAWLNLLVLGVRTRRTTHLIEKFDELAMEFRRAIRSIGKRSLELQRISEKSVRVSERDITAQLTKQYNGLLCEGSDAGRADFPDYLLCCGVEAAVKVLSDPPDVADIWLQAAKGNITFWSSPGPLPHVREDLSPEVIERLIRSRDAFRPREVGQSVSSRILANNHWERIHAAEMADKTRALGFKACVGVPLRRDGNAIGVMWLRYFRFDQLTHRELNALTIYCETLIHDADRVRSKSDDITKYVERRAVKDLGIPAARLEPAGASADL